MMASMNAACEPDDFLQDHPEINLFTEEFESQVTALSTLCEAMAGDAATAPNARASYLDRLTGFRESANLVGLTGLMRLFDQISDNFATLPADEPLPESVVTLLEMWPDMVLMYLQDPLGESSCMGLIALLEDEDWPVALSEHQAHRILEGLTQITLDDGEGGTSLVDEVTITPINDDSLSLSLAEDVNQEVLEAFLIDAPQQAQKLFIALQSITTTDNPEQPLHEAQRASHTLKGAANLLDIHAIANFSHEMEALLEKLADRYTDQQQLPTAEELDALLESSDCLSMMVDYLLGQEVIPEQRKEILQNLVNIQQGANKQASRKTDTVPEDTDSAQEVSVPKLSPTIAPDAVEEKIWLDRQVLDQLINLTESVSINRVQCDAQYQRIMQVMKSLRDQELSLQTCRYDLENLVDVRSMARVLPVQALAANDHPNVQGDFDPLELDHYDDIHRSTHQFIESVADARELKHQLNDQLLMLDGMLQEQRRLAETLQRWTMRTRQIPVHSLDSRLQRCLRQACRMTGKQAELIIEGGDVMVDRALLNNAADWLMHLLRNAVDHGIEASAVRLASNKPELGSVKIGFRIQGHYLQIQCEDDGAGIQFDQILRKASQIGWWNESQPRPDNPTLINWMTEPGFTTRDEATQVSGRGIGLDAVRHQAEQHGGHLDITEQGAFNIVLPMKQITRHLLIFKEGGQRFAIDSDQVSQIFPPATLPISEEAQQLYVQHSNKRYQLIRLADQLGGQSRQQSSLSADALTLLLVKGGRKPIALGVNELVGSEELVIKKPGGYIDKLAGLPGISILGDGSLVPVLDAQGFASQQVSTSPMLVDQENISDAENTLNTEPHNPTILVVDDSLSARSSLQQLFKDCGYHILIACDGLDAIEKMRHDKPDLIVTDLEMPRMNGLDMTRYLRHHETDAPVPVIMVTSRSQQKHQQQAWQAGVNGYITKPWTETQLLDQVQALLN